MFPLLTASPQPSNRVAQRSRQCGTSACVKLLVPLSFKKTNPYCVVVSMGSKSTLGEWRIFTLHLQIITDFNGFHIWAVFFVTALLLQLTVETHGIGSTHFYNSTREKCMFLRLAVETEIRYSVISKSHPLLQNDHFCKTGSTEVRIDTRSKPCLFFTIFSESLECTALGALPVWQVMWIRIIKLTSFCHL